MTVAKNANANETVIDDKLTEKVAEKVIDIEKAVMKDRAIHALKIVGKNTAVALVGAGIGWFAHRQYSNRNRGDMAQDTLDQVSSQA